MIAIYFAAVRAANRKHLCWTDRVKSQKSFMKKWHGVKHISVPDKYDRSCESGVQKSERERGIKMISEGSCDTEDWSNDADNSALPSQE